MKAIELEEEDGGGGGKGRMGNKGNDGSGKILDPSREKKVEAMKVQSPQDMLASWADNISFDVCWHWYICVFSLPGQVTEQASMNTS